MDKQCFIIAEIGVNHGGDVELAKEMVKSAANAGADAVKFQTFSAEYLVTPHTEKVRYQESTTSPDETHYEMIKSLEFNWNDHKPVIEYCEDVGVQFISTPYDIRSAKFLNELGVDIFKTASADIVDIPLHKYLASTGKKIIIATGMASLGEVERVVNIYREANNLNFALLHCVSNYPCALSSLNLRAMKTLADTFQCSTGFSDHSEGPLGAAISIALGAEIIEKHFTLDKDLLGPDHKASSTPQEFEELVKVVRDTEIALGSPIKRCQEEEKQMAQVSRKSIVTKNKIKAGEIVEESHFIMKRPGVGLAPYNLDKIVGKKVRSDLEKDVLVTWLDFE